MKYLGIDYGTRRIGIAVSDEDGRVAFPLTTIEAGPGAAPAVDALCKEHGVQTIVMGESRDLSGKPNPLQENIEQFAADLRSLAALPVEFEREFLTSAAAARQFAPQEKSRKANPSHAKLDAAAAALILQGYLDKKK